MLAMSTGAKSEFLQAARGYLAAAGSPTPEANIENVNGRGRLSGLRLTEADVYILVVCALPRTLMMAAPLQVWLTGLLNYANLPADVALCSWICF